MTALASEIGSAFAEMLDGSVSFERCRSVSEEEGGFSPALWQELAEGGWLEIGLRNGEDPLSVPQIVSASEQVGVHPVPGPFALTTSFVVPILERTFPDLLPRVLAGSALVTAFIPNVSWCDGGLKLELPRAELTDDGSFVLEGVRHGVPYVQFASHVLVAGEDGEGVAFIACVPTDAGAITVRPDALLDLSCPTSTVELVSLRVASSDIVRDHETRSLLERSVLLHLLALSAESLGGVSEVVGRTVEYVSNRRQFGVPVGSFQALKHALADIHTAYELGTGAVYDAAERLETSQAPAVAASTLAVRLHTAEAFARACEVAIQCHGGAGFTWEQGLHYWYRSALRLRVTPISTVDLRAALMQAVFSVA